VNDWLEQRATALDVDAPTAEEIALLLNLAGDAAHESGARTNAPLLCYLVGRAQGGRPLAEVVEIIRSTS
jgi:uncharacterized protein DUF6457